MAQCSCGSKVVFNGIHKPKGEYRFECISCDGKKWITKSDLTLEEQKEIDQLFAGVRGKPDIPTPKPAINKPKAINNQSLGSQEPGVRLSPQDVMYLRYEGKLVNIFKKVLPVKKLGYSFRPAQFELSKNFLKTLHHGGVILSEAGVGTGKTYSYCIPALLLSEFKHGFTGPVIVSTKTISLQDQLENDLMDLKNILGFSSQIPVLVTKGSGNYVCLEKLDEVRKGLSKAINEELSQWVKTTRFGDIGEVQDKLDPETLDKIRATECYSRCNQKQFCPYNNHKRLRKDFDQGILVCNHNMLAADLNMRLSDYTGLWPEPAAILVDEAHGLENACRDTLGRSFSPKSFNYIKNNILSNPTGQSAKSYVDSMDKAVNSLFKIVMKISNVAAKDDTNRFLIPIDEKFIRLSTSLLNRSKRLNEELEILSTFGQDRYGGSSRVLGIEKLDRADKKLREIIRSLESFIASPNKYYASGGLNGKNPSLFLGPVEIDTFLFQALWNQRTDTPVILTSGTLTDDGSFSLVRQRLGLTFDEDYNEFTGAQQLDLSGKIGLYIGADLPEPKDDDELNEARFTKMAAERIYELIQMSNGRALVLFTSYQRMNYVSQYLKQKNLPFPIYKQGDFAHGVLTERFRREIDSVLLATGAFWEGIDIVGQSLSLLILDKLPFPAQGDPLTKVRKKRLEAQGLKSFDNLELPEMLLRLRQGSGRLIRHENDTGIIALLDSRTNRRPYSPKIFNALPKAPELTLEEVKEFYIKVEKRNLI